MHAELNEQPKGRDAVRAALINAAADLFAERGTAAVSVREIAARAGVNHGLVHRHFGTKERLIREVMRALVDDAAEQMGDADPSESLREALLSAFLGARDGGRHWRIVARALLDGISVRDFQTEFPVFSRIKGAAARAGSDDPSQKAVHVLATGLGLLVFGSYIRSASGQRGDDWTNTLLKLLHTLVKG